MHDEPGSKGRGNTSGAGRPTKADDHIVITVDDDVDTNLGQSGSSERTPLLGDPSSAPPHQDKRVEEWPGQHDFDGLPWWKTPSIWWLLPTYLIFALAFGGILVPKLNLIITLICQEYMTEKATSDPSFSFMPIILGGDNPQCRSPDVAARTANFTLAGTLISGCLSALVSPKLGALSDRYGRKPILMYCSLGMFATELLTICAAQYPETFHVNWLLVGYLFDGLCGSFIASMAVSNSYAADCVPPQRRSITFAYFHGSLFFGMALGPIIAAYIIKATGTVVTMFYIALIVHVAFFFFLLLVIPESVSKKRQLAAREKYALEQERLGVSGTWLGQLRSLDLLEPIKILWPMGPGTSGTLRRNLFLLAATDTIMFGVAMSALTVVVIYVNTEFGWGNFESSRFVSIVNICRVSCLLGLLPLLNRLFRGPASRLPPQRAQGMDNVELGIIRLAILFEMLGFVGYSAARGGFLFTLSGAIASAGGIGSPTLQAALTKHVPNDKVGQLLGAMGFLHAIARIGGPIVFNSLFAATVGKFDQAVFVCFAATFGLAFVCSWFVKPHVQLDEPGSDNIVPEGASVVGEDVLPQLPEINRWSANGRKYSVAVTGFFTRMSTSVFLGLVFAWSFAFGGAAG